MGFFKKDTSHFILKLFYLTFYLFNYFSIFYVFLLGMFIYFSYFLKLKLNGFLFTNYKGFVLPLYINFGCYF